MKIGGFHERAGDFADEDEAMGLRNWQLGGNVVVISSKRSRGLVDSLEHRYQEPLGSRPDAKTTSLGAISITGC
jgi:hypothetical protein